MSLLKIFGKRYLKNFGARYNYDVLYLHTLLDASPDGFKAFSKFGAMGMYRKALPLEAFMVSKIAAAQTEDCEPCNELNFRMEAWVSKQTREEYQKSDLSRRIDTSIEPLGVF